MGFEFVNANDEGNEGWAVPPEELVNKNKYELRARTIADIFTRVLGSRMKNI